MGTAPESNHCRRGGPTMKRICFIALIGCRYDGFSGNKHRKRTLQDTTPPSSAIDMPLSRQIVERVGLNAEDLMAVIDQPKERLYLRGRAIAALAMLRPPGIQYTLEAICRGPYPVPLKQQAVISLARSTPTDNHPNISERLLSLLSRTEGHLASTIPERSVGFSPNPFLSAENNSPFSITAIVQIIGLQALCAKARSGYANSLIYGYSAICAWGHKTTPVSATEN